MLGFVLLLTALGAAPAPTSADRAAIEETIGHYFRAGDTSSSAELRRAFHPAAMMFFNRDGNLTGVSQPEWWARLDASRERVPALSRRIPLIDAAGDAAVAKVLSEYSTHRFEDYMSLLRIGGRWQIVGKIFHRTVPPNAPAPDPSLAAADAGRIRSALQTLFAAMDSGDGSLAASVTSPRAVAYTLVNGELVGVSAAETEARLSARSSTGPPGPKAPRRIALVDSEGDAAVARLESDLPTGMQIEYASLLKVGGRWTIMGLISVRGDAKGAAS